MVSYQARETGESTTEGAEDAIRTRKLQRDSDEITVRQGGRTSVAHGRVGFSVGRLALGRGVKRFHLELDLPGKESARFN